MLKILLTEIQNISCAIKTIKMISNSCEYINRIKYFRRKTLSKSRVCIENFVRRNFFPQNFDRYRYSIFANRAKQKIMLFEKFAAHVEFWKSWQMSKWRMFRPPVSLIPVQKDPICELTEVTQPNFSRMKKFLPDFSHFARKLLRLFTSHCFTYSFTCTDHPAVIMLWNAALYYFFYRNQ